VAFSESENATLALRVVPSPVRCPTCGAEKITYLAKARLFKCYEKHPRAKFSLKVGTIFEDSPIGLDNWLTAIWLIANAKNGISSYELSRHIGITQKSAWHVLHRVRLAVQNRSIDKLRGSVEVDETYIGGQSAEHARCGVGNHAWLRNLPILKKLPAVALIAFRLGQCAYFKLCHRVNFPVRCTLEGIGNVHRI
jgi:transposase-like protein